jgi:hypothetical protein
MVSFRERSTFEAFLFFFLPRFWISGLIFLHFYDFFSGLSNPGADILTPHVIIVLRAVFWVEKYTRGVCFACDGYSVDTVQLRGIYIYKTTTIIIGSRHISPL